MPLPPGCAKPRNLDRIIYQRRAGRRLATKTQGLGKSDCEIKSLVTELGCHLGREILLLALDALAQRHAMEGLDLHDCADLLGRRR